MTKTGRTSFAALDDSRFPGTATLGLTGPSLASVIIHAGPIPTAPPFHIVRFKQDVGRRFRIPHTDSPFAA